MRGGKVPTLRARDPGVEPRFAQLCHVSDSETGGDPARWLVVTLPGDWWWPCQVTGGDPAKWLVVTLPGDWWWPCQMTGGDPARWLVL